MWLTLSTLGTLSGCRAQPAEPDAARALSGTLFQLQNGRFSEVSEQREYPATPFQPWTVQARVSDLVVLADRVYLGVNGHGVAEVLPATNGKTGFTYFYDPLIFRYRTLTTLIPESGPEAHFLLCHLYFNKLLNVVSETELKLQGISLLRLSVSSGTYQFLTPPYQEKHPDWEAVGFIPVTPREFYLQWKYSDSNRTLFSYSRFDPEDLQEEQVEELTYRKSYGFQNPLEEAALKMLLSEVRSILDVSGISIAYQFHIRSGDRSVIRRFEYHPDDFTSAEEIRLYTLSGFRRDERLLLLLPDGLLLEASAGSRQIQRLRLPPLPRDHVYRDLLLHGQYLLASWEQAAFTEVGRAGIFFTTLPLIP
jgi:hypothetical protein